MSKEKIKTMSKTEKAVLAAIKADTSITARKIAEKIELVKLILNFFYSEISDSVLSE